MLQMNYKEVDLGIILVEQIFYRRIEGLQDKKRSGRPPDMSKDIVIK